MTWQTAALALGAAFAVSACGGRIWADREGPDGLRLHWYTQEATIEEAGARADEHCRPLGKEAVMTEEFEDQDITQAVFACR